MGNKNARQPPTKLTERHIATLKANTKFNEKEIEQWHEGFIRDSPNGKIDSTRFVEIYKQFYPNGKADMHCKYAFSTFDENSDGSIDFEEFLLAISATSSGNIDERLGVAFDLYDSSKDGKIDQKEFVKMISAIYKLAGETNLIDDRDPNERAADIVAKLDVSGDKKVSKQEFMFGCKNDPVIRQILAPDDAILEKLAENTASTKSSHTSVHTTKLS